MTNSNLEGDGVRVCLPLSPVFIATFLASVNSVNLGYDALLTILRHINLCLKAEEQPAQSIARKTSRSAIADKPRCGVGKLWQKCK